MNITPSISRVSAASLNIASCLKPVEKLPNIFQGFVDPEMTSWGSTM
jgi:hypothetical protein